MHVYLQRSLVKLQHLLDPLGQDGKCTFLAEVFSEAPKLAAGSSLVEMGRWTILLAAVFSEAPTDAGSFWVR